MVAAGGSGCSQIITSVLLTLGAMLFAINIGIWLTLPPTVKDAISQVMTDQMAFLTFNVTLCSKRLTTMLLFWQLSERY